MKTIAASIENWQIQCHPDDGGRISVLQFAGYDLLTKNPLLFKPPDRNYGEYETRPVYGYDDCFPTVDSCQYPDEKFICRDHGELCWQKWKVHVEGHRIISVTECFRPKITFKRTLEFKGNNLSWKFEVVNLSGQILPFMHVMHALMPLNEIRHFKLPGFHSILDENRKVGIDFKNPLELTAHLLNNKPGVFEMLLLKNVKQGIVSLDFRNGLILQIEYPTELFPTLGIWWNNSGYPDEDGLQRCECAFEPIPGSSSNLYDSYTEGTYLMTEPGKTLNWEINWRIEYPGN